MCFARVDCVGGFGSRDNGSNLTDAWLLLVLVRQGFLDVQSKKELCDCVCEISVWKMLQSCSWEDAVFFLVVSMTSSCSWEDAAAVAGRGRPFLSCQHGWKLASLKCWLLDSWSKALEVFPNVVTHVIDNSYQFVYHQDMNYMIVFCVWSGNEGNVLSRHKPYDMFRFQIFW